MVDHKQVDECYLVSCKWRLRRYNIFMGLNMRRNFNIRQSQFQPDKNKHSAAQPRIGHWVHVDRMICV